VGTAGDRRPHRAYDAGPVPFGFGLISCQRYPGDSRGDRELYREALDLSVLAEELGFDSVWTSEHHFVDDGYMPSLLPMCAAIAARTRRVEIGTALLLAPLYHALRLAEDAATVDLLADGRFVLGLGLGWRDEEFEALGVPKSERRQRLIAAVRVARQAWSDGVVTGTERMPYPGVSVTPKPARPGGPPIWIGGHAEPAVRRAARIADGFLSGAKTPDALARQVRWVHDELERAGRDPSGFPIGVYLETFAWTDGDAWERVRPYRHYIEWKYADMASARGATGPLPSPPALSADDERELRRGTAVGTPAEVAERIAAMREAAGGELHYVARLYYPGMELAVQREAMRVFAEDVAPLLSA
jgi:alkanesulfonate monooxygenase SsuD/methylene tetrahydromethanopterin reductase-like flavin-dependent oxidoreductase (luciferase family)